MRCLSGGTIFSFGAPVIWLYVVYCRNKQVSYSPTVLGRDRAFLAWLLDCKTVCFFSKSVKKSVKRAARVLPARSARASPGLALCFQPRSRPFVWLLARTWIRKNTVLQSTWLRANAGQPLGKNKSIHWQIAAESLENDRYYENNKISKLKGLPVS